MPGTSVRRRVRIYPRRPIENSEELPEFPRRDPQAASCAELNQNAALAVPIPLNLPNSLRRVVIGFAPHSPARNLLCGPRILIYKGTLNAGAARRLSPPPKPARAGFFFRRFRVRVTFSRKRALFRFLNARF